MLFKQVHFVNLKTCIYSDHTYVLNVICGMFSYFKTGNLGNVRHSQTWLFHLVCIFQVIGQIQVSRYSEPCNGEAIN